MIQPTRSRTLARSTSTVEATFQLWHSFFDASALWNIQLAAGTSGGDGFIIRQASGDTTTQYIFVRSSNNLLFHIDPAGTVTDIALTGLSASANSFPSWTVNYNDWQLHEWNDAFTLFSLDFRFAIVDMPWGIHAGKIINPFFESDPADGLDGTGCLIGAPISTANTTSWSSSNNSSSQGSKIKTGPTTWDIVCGDWSTAHGYYSNAPNNSANIAGRTQPLPMIPINAASRPYGVMKYIQVWNPGNNPGVVLSNGGVRKFQFFGNGHSSAYVTIMPIEDDFDPSLAP